MRVLIPLLILVSAAAPAQLRFSASSRLNDSVYVRHQIKEISDVSLWNAIDLSRGGLEKVRVAAAQQNRSRMAEEWYRYWHAKKHPRYITQTDDLVLDTDLLVSPEEFRRHIAARPGERDSVLARAERILKNTIRVWGSTEVAFGGEVDFNCEPGRSTKYGFHYWFWSRPLLMAYLHSGDRKYVRAFDRLFDRWYEQRNAIDRSIPELDVVYYELGLGTRNRLFIERLLTAGGDETPERHLRYLKTFLGAGRWLYELEKHEGYRPGNWQILGSYMLAQLALVFPEFRESSAWLECALQRMTEHLERDFFADGGHSERAPRNYTMVTFLSYRNLSCLLEWYGVRAGLSLRITELAGRTLDWWAAMLTPTGEVPAINDSHRGLFPPLFFREGSVSFDRPYLRRILHDLLGDVDGGSQPLPPFTSRHMPASGFTVMRSDWTPDALWMLLNHGPEAGFHTHRDLLSFELYAYGSPLAIDAGLGMTYDDPLYEPWYRSSRAHNMVTVGSREIEREGTSGENIVWGSTPGLDFFAGEHGGYRSIGVKHRRSVVFLRPEYWFILDRVVSPRDGDTLTWNIHSPGGLEEWQGGFRSTGVPGLNITPAGGSYKRRISRGWAASTSDRRPGRVEEIDWAMFDQRSVRDSVMEFPILLEPFREKGARSAERISARHFVVRSAAGADHLYFIEGGYDDGDVKAAGNFLLIREREGRRTHVLLGGTFLSVRGKVLWTSPRPENVETGAE